MCVRVCKHACTETQTNENNEDWDGVIFWLLYPSNSIQFKAVWRNRSREDKGAALGKMAFPKIK
jgi:hypothetical protein